MKLQAFALSALLGSALAVQADITGVTLYYDPTNVMYCTFSDVSPVGTGTHAFQQSIYGDQVAFDTGNVYGNILTDGTDPALTLSHTIDNDTSVTWTDYHVVVTMSQSFSITNVTVDHGWSESVTAPALMSGSYVGYIDFLAGTPVVDGDALNFAYTMSFTGSVSFSETLTPSATPVPEPGGVVLLICGLGGLFTLRRRAAARPVQ